MEGKPLLRFPPKTVKLWFLQASCASAWLWWWGNLSPLSCGRLHFSPTPSVVKTRSWRHWEAHRAAQAPCSRHPIKAPGTSCSGLSQLGCVGAQIFEQRSAAALPLAEHHRIQRPKQKFLRQKRGPEEWMEWGNACLWTFCLHLNFIKYNVDKEFLQFFFLSSL